MGTQFSLRVVAGAPGSGKSTVVEACLNSADIVALDVDSLIASASVLANRDIHFAPETWPAYNQLWLDVMHSILRNGVTAVLFAPLAPPDLAPLPAWCCEVRWLLLDCPDDVLRERLSQRQWSKRRIREAIEDAVNLRDTPTEYCIDTSRQTSVEVAEAITKWARA
jgi:broad-specificity NMP kinase